MTIIKKFYIKLLLSLFILLTSSVASAEVAVIVNIKNLSSISDSDVPRLFLGKLKKYSTGEAVTIINLKYKEAIRNEFEKKSLKKSASQVKAYWSKLMFSGKGKPPKEFASDKEVIAFVTANVNAIAYVDAKSVDDSVKVVKKY
ncbi:MAG: phosphate ABC transporter substrate-binding protein [Colwellia sp.]